MAWSIGMFLQDDLPASHEQQRESPLGADGSSACSSEMALLALLIAKLEVAPLAGGHKAKWSCIPRAWRREKGGGEEGRSGARMHRA